MKTVDLSKGSKNVKKVEKWGSMEMKSIYELMHVHIVAVKSDDNLKDNRPQTSLYSVLRTIPLPKRSAWPWIRQILQW